MCMHMCISIKKPKDHGIKRWKFVFTKRETTLWSEWCNMFRTLGKENSAKKVLSGLSHDTVGHDLWGLPDLQLNRKDN